jgi:hypothetical protein
MKTRLHRGALGNRANTSREVIRNYFLNDFFKNALQILSESAPSTGCLTAAADRIQALVYMHPLECDIPLVKRPRGIRDTASSGSMRKRARYAGDDRQQLQVTPARSAAAEMRKEKLTQKSSRWPMDYDTKIAHIALSGIDLDLDDGVKVNYERRSRLRKTGRTD